MLIWEPVDRGANPFQFIATRRYCGLIFPPGPQDKLREFSDPVRRLIVTV